MANCILSTRWPNFVSNDKLLWRGFKAGVFLVESCFEINTFGSERAALVLWEKVWKLNIHARLKMFLWRVFAGVWPSRDVIV